MYVDDMTPPQMAQGIKDLRIKRKAIEKKIDEIKEFESLLEGRLLMYLDAQGVESVRMADVGTLSKRKDKHVEIRDANKLAAYVDRAITAAKQNGTPILDALCVFQRRAAKANILDILEQGVTAEEIGVEVVEKVKLSLTAK